MKSVHKLKINKPFSKSLCIEAISAASHTYSHKYIRILLLMNVLWWFFYFAHCCLDEWNSFVKQFNFPIVVDGCAHTHTHTHNDGDDEEEKKTCHQITCSTYIFIALIDFHIATVPFCVCVCTMTTWTHYSCIPHAKCEWNQLNTRAYTSRCCCCEGWNEM